MTDTDKKWLFILCAAIGVAFLIGRILFWTINIIFTIEEGSALDQLMGFLTPAIVFIAIGIVTVMHRKKTRVDE